MPRDESRDVWLYECTHSGDDFQTVYVSTTAVPGGVRHVPHSQYLSLERENAELRARLAGDGEVGLGK